MIANYGKRTVIEYLNKGPYYIPDYQRDYAWDEKNEIRELWEDITSVYKNDIKEFFMGQVVLHCDVSLHKQFIIDGQQRTITLTLLCVAFRNTFLCLSNSISDKAYKMVCKINSFLGLIDKDDHEEKLFLGDSDNSFFIDKILYGRQEDIENLKPKRKAQKNLVNGYLYLYKKINTFCENEANEKEKTALLKKLYEKVSTSLCLLSMETTDESEAFMIFETLNARGRDLETSDLLKNYFFRISSTNFDVVKQNWNLLAADFETGSITNYIRCIWNSQHTFEREKMLYKTISNNCKTPKEALEFSKMMMDGKDIYLSMVDPENKFAFSATKETTELKNVLLDLSDLKIKTYYPLILAYYLQNEDKPMETVFNDLVKIAKAVETLIFREIIISKNNPNSYEKIFAEIAKSISDMTVISVDDIINEIKKNTCSEEVFKLQFSEYTEKGTAQGKNKIRYILRKIINSETKELKVARNNSEVHIEHIMPVKLGNWDISEDDHEANLWKIGNLTLLDYEINEEIKNSLFNIKCEEYVKSDIKMTRDLTNYEKWDVQSINERQMELYALSQKVWNF